MSSWRSAPRPSCIRSRSSRRPPLPPAPGTMFQRGRLDHFALLAPSEETFREIRRRVEACAGPTGRPSTSANPRFSTYPGTGVARTVTSLGRRYRITLTTSTQTAKGTQKR